MDVFGVLEFDGVGLKNGIGVIEVVVKLFVVRFESWICCVIFVCLINGMVEDCDVLDFVME